MNSVYTAFIQGLDVTDFIMELSGFPLAKTDLGQIIEIPAVNLVLDNSKNAFTPGHPNSIFVVSWKGVPVQVYKFGDLIFEGIIKNAAFDTIGFTVRAEVTADINNILNARIPGFLTDYMTIAALSEKLYLEFGIETDRISYARAKHWHDLLLFKARGNIKVSSQTTLTQAQEWLARVGMCRHYFIGQVAYLDFYDTYNNIPSALTFTDIDVITIDNFGLIDKDTYDGFEVTTAAGTAKKEGGNLLPTVPGGPEDEFILPTPEAGYTWGNRMLNYSNKDIFQIGLQLTETNRSGCLSLGSVFKLQSDLLGIDKDFEVVSLDYTPLLGPQVIGQTL